MDLNKPLIHGSRVSGSTLMELKRQLSYFLTTYCVFFVFFLWFKHARAVGIFEVVWEGQRDEWRWLEWAGLVWLQWRSGAEAPSLCPVWPHLAAFILAACTSFTDRRCRRVVRQAQTHTRVTKVAWRLEPLPNRGDSRNTIFNFLFSSCRKCLAPCQEMAQASLFGSACCVYIFTQPQRQDRTTLTVISIWLPHYCISQMNKAAHVDLLGLNHSLLREKEPANPCPVCVYEAPADANSMATHL